MELYRYTLHEASELLQKKEITSEELTKSYLARIKAVEPQVKAFVTVTEELALEQARAIDKKQIGRAHV